MVTAESDGPLQHEIFTAKEVNHASQMQPKHVEFQAHMLWVSVLEAFSCPAYVLYGKFILLKIK